MWGHTDPLDRIVHVVPLNDLIEHDLDDDCVCVPTAALVPTDDGSDGWVIKHHSLDGRELREVDQAPPATPGG